MMFGSKPPIGVDIGSHTVKVCQLKRVGEKYELEKFGMAEIYPAGDQPTDPNEIVAAKVAALKKALETSKIKSKHSISAVSGESIIVRYLQLPKMPEEELKKALQWEAEEYIPFRLSEVNIDSMVLGQATDSENPKMDVLLVSAKKDLVEEHVSILKAAGLEPKVVDVDAFAFLNCFELNHKPGKEECVALINIGSAITSINIYTAGVSRFSRDIPVGGEAMTTAIKARQGCSFVEAERLKIAIGAPLVEQNINGNQVDTLAGSLLDDIRGTIAEMTNQEADSNSTESVTQQAIQNVLNNMLSEIRRSIEFFENQYREYNVTRVVLGGGTAMLGNLSGHFEKELGLPTEMIDPLRNVRYPNDDEMTKFAQTIRHQLGVGIGLSLRGMMTA